MNKMTFAKKKERGVP